MVKDVKTLRIVQASFLFSLSPAEAEHDIKKLLTLRAHIYMGTESGDRDRKQLFQWLFTAAGYTIYTPDGTDAWIAVKRSLIGTGYRFSYKQLHGTGKQEHDPHHYDAKGVVLVEFDHPGLGHVGIVECHYMRTNVTGDREEHIRVNRMLAHGLSEALLRSTHGNQGIGFFGADTNMLDNHSDVFFGMPLKTCWDELHKYPPTHGKSTIDVVGSCNEDQRVMCKSARVLDDKDFFLHADHYVVVTEYDVIKL